MNSRKLPFIWFALFVVCCWSPIPTKSQNLELSVLLLGWNCWRIKNWVSHDFSITSTYAVKIPLFCTKPLMYSINHNICIFLLFHRSKGCMKEYPDVANIKQLAFFVSICISLYFAVFTIALMSFVVHQSSLSIFFVINWHWHWGNTITAILKKKWTNKSNIFVYSYNHIDTNHNQLYANLMEYILHCGNIYSLYKECYPE